MATPTTHEQSNHELVDLAFEIIEDNTDTMEAAAARRGISLSTLRRRIKRGEIKQTIVGRDVRVWR